MFMRNGVWMISWYDHNGKRKCISSGTSDKEAAKRILAKEKNDVALRKRGLIDPELEVLAGEGKRTIKEHLKDYEAKMRAGKPTDKHVKRTIGFIRDLTTAAGCKAVRDITADKINAQTVKLLEDEGYSARSVQARLTAIKGFTKWLSERNKLTRDPLASVRKPSPQSDRRRERRMLLPDEWRWLRLILKADATERFGMPAGERLLLYAAALETGLRANELRSLKRGSFFLTDSKPYVKCKAGTTKNRQEAKQYLTPALAADLKRHIATKLPQAGVFTMPHECDVAKMLREDIDAARAAWLRESIRDPQERSNREQSDFLKPTNDGGEVLDFHALRHTCGAWAAMAGAHANEVKALMRHSTITLTMDTYGHLFPGQEAETIHRLATIMQPALLAATGTDDSVSAAVALPTVRESTMGACERKRTSANCRTTGQSQGTRSIPAENADSGDLVPRLSTVDYDHRPSGGMADAGDLKSPSG